MSRKAVEALANQVELFKNRVIDLDDSDKTHIGHLQTNLEQNKSMKENLPVIIAETQSNIGNILKNLQDQITAELDGNIATLTAQLKDFGVIEK